MMPAPKGRRNVVDGKGLRLVSVVPPLAGVTSFSSRQRGRHSTSLTGAQVLAESKRWRRREPRRRRAASSAPLAAPSRSLQLGRLHATEQPSIPLRRPRTRSRLTARVGNVRRRHLSLTVRRRIVLALRRCLAGRSARPSFVPGRLQRRRGPIRHARHAVDQVSDGRESVATPAHTTSRSV
jgi:hypothetical protein